MQEKLSNLQIKKIAVCLGAGIIIACFFWQLKIFQEQLSDIQSDLRTIRRERETGIYQLRQQFEYSIAAPSDTTFVEEMNLWGSAGWEAVSARRATKGYGRYQVPMYEVILKRPH